MRQFDLELFHGKNGETIQPLKEEYRGISALITPRSIHQIMDTKSEKLVTGFRQMKNNKIERIQKDQEYTNSSQVKLGGKLSEMEVMKKFDKKMDKDIKNSMIGKKDKAHKINRMKKKELQILINEIEISRRDCQEQQKVIYEAEKAIQKEQQQHNHFQDDKSKKRHSISPKMIYQPQIQLLKGLNSTEQLMNYPQNNQSQTETSPFHDIIPLQITSMNDLPNCKFVHSEFAQIGINQQNESIVYQDDTSFCNSLQDKKASYLFGGDSKLSSSDKMKGGESSGLSINQHIQNPSKIPLSEIKITSLTNEQEKNLILEQEEYENEETEAVSAKLRERSPTQGNMVKKSCFHIYFKKQGVEEEQTSNTSIELMNSVNALRTSIENQDQFPKQELIDEAKEIQWENTKMRKSIYHERNQETQSGIEIFKQRKSLPLNPSNKRTSILKQQNQSKQQLLQINYDIPQQSRQMPQQSKQQLQSEPKLLLQQSKQLQQEQAAIQSPDIYYNTTINIKEEKVKQRPKKRTSEDSEKRINSARTRLEKSFDSQNDNSFQLDHKPRINSFFTSSRPQSAATLSAPKKIGKRAEYFFEIPKVKMLHKINNIVGDVQFIYEELIEDLINYTKVEQVSSNFVKLQNDISETRQDWKTDPKYLATKQRLINMNREKFQETGKNCDPYFEFMGYSCAEAVPKGRNHQEVVEQRMAYCLYQKDEDKKQKKKEAKEKNIIIIDPRKIKANKILYKIDLLNQELEKEEEEEESQEKENKQEKPKPEVYQKEIHQIPVGVSSARSIRFIPEANNSKSERAITLGSRFRTYTLASAKKRNISTNYDDSNKEINSNNISKQHKTSNNSPGNNTSPIRRTSNSIQMQPKSDHFSTPTSNFSPKSKHHPQIERFKNEFLQCESSTSLQSKDKSEEKQIANHLENPSEAIINPNNKKKDKEENKSYLQVLRKYGHKLKEKTFKKQDISKEVENFIMEDILNKRKNNKTNQQLTQTADLYFQQLEEAQKKMKHQQKKIESEPDQRKKLLQIEKMKRKFISKQKLDLEKLYKSENQWEIIMSDAQAFVDQAEEVNGKAKQKMETLKLVPSYSQNYMKEMYYLSQPKTGMRFHDENGQALKPEKLTFLNEQ